MFKNVKINRRGKVWMRRIQRFILTTVIGGLVVVLPVTLFVIVLRLLFNLIAGFVEPVGRLLPFSDDIARWLVQLMALVIVILIFFLIGLFVRTELGSKFFKNMEERLLYPLPLYKTLRETVRQFIGAEKMPFSQVVLADVFGGNTLVTAFVTDELGNGYYTIFVPTAPNPTNGFVFHVHESKLKFLDVRTEDALRSVIGLGTGSNVLFNAKDIGLHHKNPLEHPASEPDNQ